MPARPPTGTELDSPEGDGGIRRERSDVFELTDRDLLDHAVVRYGGRYELLSLVGAGTYGSVYRARDTELGEIVAVKVLRREHIAQPDTLERFRREVRLARRVAHPNVARTYDIGSHNDERFLTMEYIDGQPLTRLSPVNTAVDDLLPLRLVIDIGVQLCAGLAALHAAGIIHRDLKTDNVLVEHQGRVVITDFGIARVLKAADGDTGGYHSGANILIGTPAYMAPEQVRGNAQVDTRADLYGLGVMLFQLLTGQLPFAKSSALETALARLYEAPLEPLGLRADLPRGLADFLRRSLECSVDARFQTATEMASALAAERPTGPGLAEYLRARVAAPRRVALPGGPPADATQASDRLSVGSTSSYQGPAPTLSVSPPNLTPGARQLAVTVLLFRFPGDKSDEYLAHGLTEEIIDRLTEAEGLLVTGFSVVRALGSEQRDPGIVAAKLQAQVVVDGTLRVSPAGLSATVRLIEVERGLQLAVRRFERSDRNVLSLALEISQLLGGLLTAHVNEDQGGIVSDAVAVDLYMQARHQYHIMSSHALTRSVELFEQALDRLPDEPMLLTGYALALARHWFFAGEGAGMRATLAAERAVRAAPEAEESFLALAMVQFNSNRNIEAASSLRWALARSPRLAESHELLGHVLTEVGPMELALRHLNYSLLRDKPGPLVLFSLARAHVLSGQCEAAFTLLIREGWGGELAFARWAMLARSLCWCGDRQQARRYLDEPMLAAAKLQRPRQMIEFAAGERLLTLEEYVPRRHLSASTSVRGRIFGLQMVVEYHCFRGQLDAALQALRQLARLAPVDIQWLEHCPVLAALRSAPEFPALRAPIAELARQVQRALGINEQLSGWPLPAA